MAFQMTPEHWIFIPSVFFLGMVVGFLIGQARADSKSDSDQ